MKTEHTTDTSETDEFWMQIDDSEFDTTQIVNKLKQFERERDEARNQLSRICAEGFDMQDTIGLEPADDYVLRQVEKMRGIKEERDQLSRDVSTIMNALPHGAHDVAEGVSEIAAMRERLNSAEFRLTQEKNLNSDHEQDYLAVWKLIKQPNETVVHAVERIVAENAAMRDAIKEAGKVLLDILRNHECGIEVDMKCETALAKLQPFIK